MKHHDKQGLVGVAIISAIILGVYLLERFL